MTEQERKEKRFTARQGLLVSCPSWGEFVQLYGADISQGGMFIVTDDPPPILSAIEVKIGLPEGHEISLTGRVVHVISGEQAKIEGRDAGVGVEFRDLDSERKLQIQQLIDFAETSGADPNASFSRHLLEVSPSQRPGRILDSLPPPARASSVPVPAAVPGPAAVPEPAAVPASASRRSSRPSQRPRVGTRPSPTPARISSRPGSEPSPSDTGEHVLPSEPADAARISATSMVGDPAKVRLGMTHLSYKRYAQAQRTFEAVLSVSPEDHEAKKWLLVTRAREALSKKKEQAAADAYQELLEVDEANHEARKFVRSFHMNKRFGSLPFARYFQKKKP